MKSNLLRIMAIVAIVLLAAVLFGGLVCTFIVASKGGGTWPLYVFVGILLVFGWDNIYGTFKWLVDRAFPK